MAKALQRVPILSLGVVLAVAAWSALNPYDRFTWWMETIPVFVAIILLWTTGRRFRFTDMLYVLIALHCIVLLVGGHYTYALVPLFDWIRDWFGLARNHYDRFGHFMQGFVPAMVARELLIRTSPLKPGKWLFAVIVLSCLGISAAYELIEWAVSAATGEAAESFLGTQGDIWDTQKDIAMALVGAVSALILLSGAHNRALAKLG